MGASGIWGIMKGIIVRNDCRSFAGSFDARRRGCWSDRTAEAPVEMPLDGFSTLREPPYLAWIKDQPECSDIQGCAGLEIGDPDDPLDEITEISVEAGSENALFLGCAGTKPLQNLLLVESVVLSKGM